jgi:endo-alpha-1,4-polygalactosaminidase (GH114 family)
MLMRKAVQPVILLSCIFFFIGANTSTCNYWKPAPGTSWQWQIDGTIDTSLAVKMYDVDLFDTDQTVIDQLHSKGITVICYFSAGSRENWRPDANQFPSSALGNPLEGWSGERWLDIRDSTVRSIMLSRMDLAVSKHCDGVEPDNVDGYQPDNHSGFDFTADDQLQYNTFLAFAAHFRNLSVGLKNDVEQVAQLVTYFDWALNEECFQNKLDNGKYECELLLPFIQAGKAVFHVEYTDQVSSSEIPSICSRANAYNFDTLIKNRDLDAYRYSCR